MLTHLRGLGNQLLDTMVFGLHLGRRQRLIVDGYQTLNLAQVGLIDVQQFPFSIILLLFAIGPQGMVLCLYFDFLAEYVAGKLIGARW